MVTLQVDDQAIEAAEGTSLLRACLDNGIYIPNLCQMEGQAHPTAACRLCFVAIEGLAKPVTSCTVRVARGLVVRTDTEAVRRLQRSALRLLLSVHHVDCGHCPANKRCDLQKIARFLKVGLKPKGLERYLKQPEVISVHPLIDYYPNRCVLCGKCVQTCKNSQGQPLLAFARRGFDTIISAFGAPQADPPDCSSCLACIDICPVAAILVRKDVCQPSAVSNG